MVQLRKKLGLVLCNRELLHALVAGVMLMSWSVQCLNQRHQRGKSRLVGGLQ